jgi:hypothetical protein
LPLIVAANRIFFQQAKSIELSECLTEKERPDDKTQDYFPPDQMGERDGK